ncbi:MAG TPA: hypothetical protein VHX65_03455 [Pirellulales bacterium]|jgi:hypothetical protein|nr:hypothetical protein [Pirellulales bacterium]
MHKILEAERARDIAERRGGRRHPYRCTQWVAAVDERSGGELEFRPVQCVDLSAAGLLYLADEPPATTELVVALGSKQPIRLRAQVLRADRIVQRGRIMHRVACRFTDRTI